MLLKFTFKSSCLERFTQSNFSGVPTAMFAALVATVSALRQRSRHLWRPISPTAPVQYTAPTPVVSCAAPGPVIEHIAPAPVVTHQTAPVVMDMTIGATRRVRLLLPALV